MTREEWNASASRGSVPAVHDDGCRVLALDVIEGRRVFCSDWILSDHLRCSDGTQDEIDRVKKAIDDGVIEYVEYGFEDEEEFSSQADYFLPGQLWRHHAIQEACKIDDDYRCIVIGMLKGYSDDDINAFIKRNYEDDGRGWTCFWRRGKDVYEKAMKDWELAYNWVRGKR